MSADHPDVDDCDNLTFREGRRGTRCGWTRYQEQLCEVEDCQVGVRRDQFADLILRLNSLDWLIPKR